MGPLALSLFLIPRRVQGVCVSTHGAVACPPVSLPSTCSIQCGVCNHCERMMDGLRLDDMIAGNREGSLTEDEIVQYVQDGDPNQRDWDEFPLRMTFRINAFLRAHGPVGDVDLAALGFLDED